MFDSPSGSTLVRHRQQLADPPYERVLRHRRIGERPQLLQGRLLVLQPQRPGIAQMVRRVLAEDVQCSGDPNSRRSRPAALTA